MKNVHAIVLGAGKGTRMNSALPKMLQPLGGAPLLSQLLDTLQEVDVRQTLVVIGYLGEKIRAALSLLYPDLQWVEQEEQLGTAHAVLQGLSFLPDEGMTLILLGDCPLLRPHTLSALCREAEENDAVLLSAVLDEPHGYGRVVRDERGNVCAIVEEKDADETQRAIAEINTGVMVVKNTLLKKYVPQIENHNAQQEYYLTDLISLLYRADYRIQALIAEDARETVGINDRRQLAAAECLLRERKAEELLAQGATLIDPARIDVHGKVKVGQDVIIEPNVFFKGKVVLGSGVRIESGCVLQDCVIGAGTTIAAMSVIENAAIGEACAVGPFARIRPQTVLKARAKVGNFVEIKAASVGEGSKVNHLSYIGDATLGVDVNIGAGTITCNYDGVNKFKTEIADHVFIGSNSALVAPVSIGAHSTIGAGSVITRDVERDCLALTRAKLRQIEGWESPAKKKAQEDSSDKTANG